LFFISKKLLALSGHRIDRAATRFFIFKDETIAELNWEILAVRYHRLWMLKASPYVWNIIGVIRRARRGDKPGHVIRTVLQIIVVM
jgi:hypothetical protein